MFALDGIDDHGLFCTRANDHPLIYVCARSYKQRAAFLQIRQRKRERFSRETRDHGAGLTAHNLALVWTVVRKHVRERPFAFRRGNERHAIPKKSARWDAVLKARGSVSGCHVRHLALSSPEHFNNRSGTRIRHIDRERLIRLFFLTVAFADDGLWLAHLKFISFSTHGFNEHRKVHLTPAAD